MKEYIKKILTITNQELDNINLEKYLQYVNIDKDFGPYFDKKSGIEHYRLLSYISSIFKDVKLLDGSPFKNAMEKDAAYLLVVEPNRLLHRFYLNAGLPTKGEIYGGWESDGLSGHTLGHYLSACALFYANTGNVEFKSG